MQPPAFAPLPSNYLQWIHVKPGLAPGFFMDGLLYSRAVILGLVPKI